MEQANIETTENPFDAWMRANGVTYSAAFVPFSISRNAKPLRECKTHELSINWRVTFAKGGKVFTTDFQQGIGHLPGYCGKQGNRDTGDHRADVIEACEKGRAPVRLGSFATLRVNPPSVADVLECLAFDYSALDSDSYEEWADEYGFETDSRKGEAIYETCRRQGIEFRALVGHQAMRDLRAVEAT